MKSLAFLVIALLLPPPLAKAAPLDLFAGSVEVADQSAAERDRAMRLALAEVLQKLSGLRTFEDRPEVGVALEGAAALAVSFYYRNRQVILPDGGSAEQLELVATFARKPVDELMRALQLPVWKPERRPLTVWLVVDDDLGRRIMPIELEYAWAQMAQAAADRGLPVRRPEPDAEGVYPVDLQLLWGGFTEELQTDGRTNVLVVAAHREGPEWQLRMNLDYGGQRRSWRQRDVALEAMLVEGIHRAVDEIASHATIAATDLGRWTREITVTGVRNAGDYARCLNYLKELSLIESVRIISAAPGQLRLGLALNALPEYLGPSLEQDGMLAATGTAWEYTLVPQEGGIE